MPRKMAQKKEENGSKWKNGKSDVSENLWEYNKQSKANERGRSLSSEGWQRVNKS